MPCRIIISVVLLILGSFLPAAWSQEMHNDSLYSDSLSADEGITAADSSIYAETDDFTNILADPASQIKEVFEKSPAFIIALYIVIIYSIVTMFSLTVFILFNRAKMKREEELKSRLSEQYQQLLLDFMFSEEENEKIISSLAAIANNHFRKQILIDQIIEVCANLQGETKEKLKSLYLDLGLKQDSLKKAHSKKWHENIKGFRELAFMNIREANDRILECLNSNNEILRMEAQISMVRLSDDNPYAFLDHLKKPLAVWEQITLHELVSMHGLNIPDFSQWFDSDNLSIVIFSLHMVSWFKQENAEEGIIKLLYHPDDSVRLQAIRVCGDLTLKPALEHLQKIYDGENYRNKLEILSSFARTPDETYLDYLNDVLDKEEDVQLQISATKAMENTGEPGISRLIRLMKRKSEFKNYQIIIRHVLDGRIY